MGIESRKVCAPGPAADIDITAVINDNSGPDFAIRSTYIRCPLSSSRGIELECMCIRIACQRYLKRACTYREIRTVRIAGCVNITGVVGA
jgi:hypothetical protein